jgi:Tfp pilus assembly protein PilF
MPRRARTLRAAFPAGSVPPVLALLLSACAGPQRPAAAEGAGAPRPAVALAEAPSAPAAAIAAANAAALVPAAPPPARSAREAFQDAVRLAAAGDLEGAVQAFDAASAADPALVWASFDAGVLRERLSDDDGARAAYARALDSDPAFGPAAQNLARLELRRRRAGEAEQDLRARLERSPDAVGLRNGLAELHLAAGRLDQAEEESRRALKADERNVAAMVNLATVYHRKKRHELARMVLENARQIDDRDPAVWNRLGFVELALGNRPQAFEDFRTAAALRPDFPEAHANYGAMLADAEDYAAAVTELELAVKHAPRSAPAWLVLGNAYRGEKQFAKAEDAYRKAAELDPELVEVSFNLAVLYLDGDKPGTPALARLDQAVQFFDAYEAKGGKDAKIPEYRKDAARAIDREKKRLAREEKDRLRRDAEARKKEEEARREAEARARKAEEEERARRVAEPAAPVPPAPATTPDAPDAATAKTPSALEAPPAPAPAGGGASAPSSSLRNASGEERGDR